MIGGEWRHRFMHAARDRACSEHRAGLAAWRSSGNSSHSSSSNPVKRRAAAS